MCGNHLALSVALLRQRSLMKKHPPPPPDAEIRSLRIHVNPGRLISVSVAFSSSHVTLKPITALSLYSLFKGTQASSSPILICSDCVFSITIVGSGVLNCISLDLSRMPPFLLLLRLFGAAVDTLGGSDTRDDTFKAVCAAECIATMPAANMAVTEPVHSVVLTHLRRDLQTSKTSETLPITLTLHTHHDVTTVENRT